MVFCSHWRRPFGYMYGEPDGTLFDGRVCGSRRWIDVYFRFCVFESMRLWSGCSVWWWCMPLFDAKSDRGQWDLAITAGTAWRPLRCPCCWYVRFQRALCSFFISKYSAPRCQMCQFNITLICAATEQVGCGSGAVSGSQWISVFHCISLSAHYSST